MNAAVWARCCAMCRAASASAEGLGLRAYVHGSVGSADRDLPGRRADPGAAVSLFSLDGKVALVTGGTRGIGLMVARGFLQAGAQVYVSSRKAQAGDEAVEALSPFGTVVSLPADVSTQAECVRLAAEVASREGSLDILVNNAGATWGAPLQEFPEAGWDKVLDLNLKAPFYLSRACLPMLTATGTTDDPSRIINVGSIDGLRVPELPTYSYSASKAAVHQLTREIGERRVGKSVL